jgi:hypothetical protein
MNDKRADRRRRVAVLVALGVLAVLLGPWGIFHKKQEKTAAAQQTVKLDLEEYKEGTLDYATVITAEATSLSASLNVLALLQQRLQASVLLVENLGGGWSATDLPKG